MFPFTLRQLEVFDKICQKNSFREAAEELNISQPAISRQIAALENQLGFKLFARAQGRATKLTVQGMGFRKSLNEFLEAGHRLAANRKDRPDAPTRTYRIYVASHLMEDVVRPKLGELLPIMGGIELDFLPVSPRITSARAFPKYKIDIGLYCVADWETERTAPGTSWLGEVASGVYGHVDFYRENLGIEDVNKLPFILPPRGSPEEQPTIEYLANSAGIVPSNPVAWSVHVDVIRQLVEQGTAVTYLLETMVRPFCKRTVCLWEGGRWTRAFYQAPGVDVRIASVLKEFFLSCIADVDERTKASTLQVREPAR